MTPGEYFIDDGDIELNAGRATVTIKVANSGDRPIQVGSHYHFHETNNALVFDRAATLGFRLNIPAGTAVRFEPGQERTVELVAYGGDAAKVYGFLGRVMGPLDRHEQDLAPRLRRHVRADDGRPRAPRPTPSSSSRSRPITRSTATRSSSAAAR